MSAIKIRRAGIVPIFIFLFLAVTVTAAMANLEIVKTYKATFEGEKPKCTNCHVDKTPKKEDGKHNPNDYGKKILAAKKELNKEKVDEEVLKKVGKNETPDE